MLCFMAMDLVCKEICFSVKDFHCHLTASCGRGIHLFHGGGFMRFDLRLLILFLALLAFVTCGSTPSVETGRNEEPLRPASEEYASYLVPQERYTTAGGDLQKKHRPRMLQLAQRLETHRSILISKETLGFYYDRKADDRNRLYLGFDIDAGSYSEDAMEIGPNLIMGYAPEVISVVCNFRDILDEPKVHGMVVALHWKRTYGTDKLTLWIDREPCERYLAKKITLKELLRQSTVTDKNGRVILLHI